MQFYVIQHTDNVLELMVMYMYIQYIKYVIIIVSYIFQAEGYNYLILLL